MYFAVRALRFCFVFSLNDDDEGETSVAEEGVCKREAAQPHRAD